MKFMRGTKLKSYNIIIYYLVWLKKSKVSTVDMIVLFYFVSQLLHWSYSVVFDLVIKYSTNRFTNMAMHVPKAPGFAQMLKDGAKVLWMYLCINNKIRLYFNICKYFCQLTVMFSFRISKSLFHVIYASCGILLLYSLKAWKNLRDSLVSKRLIIDTHYFLCNAFLN